MLKGFTRIAAFVLAFGVSVSLVGLLFGFSAPSVPSVQTGNLAVGHEITTFLRQDISNGRFRDRSIQRRIAAGYTHEYDSNILFVYQSTEDYVNASSSMNDASLPADLKYAWHDHMEAWAAHTSLLKEGEARSHTVAGCCDADFMGRYRNSSRKINSTWDQVLRIAERYGADTRGMR